MAATKPIRAQGVIVIAEQGRAVTGVAGHDVQQHLACREKPHPRRRPAATRRSGWGAARSGRSGSARSPAPRTGCAAAGTAGRAVPAAASCAANAAARTSATAYRLSALRVMANARVMRCLRTTVSAYRSHGADRSRPRPTSTTANKANASDRRPSQATSITIVTARKSAVNSIFAPDASEACRYPTMSDRTAPFRNGSKCPSPSTASRTATP